MFISFIIMFYVLFMNKIVILFYSYTYIDIDFYYILIIKNLIKRYIYLLAL